MYYSQICQDFQRMGYNFIYFPRLSEELTQEVVNHLYPAYDGIPVRNISLKSNLMLEFLSQYNDYYMGPSLLFSLAPPHSIHGDDDEKEFWFPALVIEDLSQCYLVNSLTPLLDQIIFEKENWEELELEAMDEDRIIRDLSRNNLHLDEYYDCFVEEDDDFFGDEKEMKKIANQSNKKAKKLIEDIHGKIDELNQFDKDYSIFSYCLRREPHYYNLLSDIHVTAKCKVLFPGYKMELKLSPQFKAIYLMYLNHPEGISFNNIDEGKEELIQWLQWAKPSIDKQKATEYIEDKLEAKGGREPITELICRTNAKVIEALGTSLARKYGINQNDKGIHQIDIRGYKVTMDLKNPFKKILGAGESGKNKQKI